MSHFHPDMIAGHACMAEQLPGAARRYDLRSRWRAGIGGALKQPDRSPI